MIIEAPQRILDQIVDRLIENSPGTAGFRWVMQMDACRLDFRRREGICECGEEIK